MIEIKTAEEFCQRLRERKTVSSAEVNLAFRWDAKASVLLRRCLTNLTWANLTGADLTWADLTGADLTGANLTGANLTGANLTGANLTGAKGTFTFNFGVKLQVKP